MNGPTLAPTPEAVDPALRARAAAHERHLLRAGNPVAWLALHAAGRLGSDVCRLPGLGYLVTGAEAAQQVLTDAGSFAKNGPGSSAEVVTPLLGPAALTNMDGEAHLELRRAVHGAMPRDLVGRISRSVTEAHLDRLVDRLRRGEAPDLARFARIVTGSLALELLGAPATRSAGETESMALRVFADSRRLTEFMSVPIRVPGEQAVREGRALAHRILAPAEAAWRRSDANTVPGRLREAGLPLSATRSVLGMIVVASVETTASAVPRLLALLSDLELWDAVSSSPLPLERWVDEGLRYLAPLPAVTRSVRIHRSLRGRRLKAGKPVLVVLRSALRDPRVIDRPEDFDPGRPIPSILRNLWFGAGAHYCVGGPVTTTQLCDIVGALAREVGPLEVLDRSPAIRTLLPHYASLRLRRRTGRDAALVTGART